MKIPLTTSLAGLLLIFTTLKPVQAQDNKPVIKSMSLKEAQEYAVKNNANSRNSAIDMELAKKKIWETTAIGLPQINAQANYQHLFKVPELSLGGTTYLATDLPPGTPVTSDHITNENVFMGFTPAAPIALGVPNNTTLDITVTQLIFSGEYIVGLQATKVFYEMTDQSRQKTEIDLKESVANTYAMALSFEQTRNILEQTLVNTKKTLSDMQQMYKQGLIENTDVDQIELITLNLTNGLSSMNRQLDATYDLLKFQLGMPFSDKIVLTDNLEGIANTVNLETLMATPFNINNNLDYQILETSERIGNLNLKREKSTYLPNLAAVYRHQEKVNQPAFDFNPKDVVGVTMNIPIFSSGSRNVKVQQRQLDLKKIINTKENVANGLQLQYINAKNELTTAYEKYLNDKKNIDLTQRIYDKTLIKFNEGLATSREITDNLAQYLTAQSNMYSSILSLISAKNKLDKLNNNL
ncbi:MAG: TolC family protein [Bacteroidales bacterium]